MTDAQIAALMGWPLEHMADVTDPLSMVARVRALVAAAEAGEREKGRAEIERLRAALDVSQAATAAAVSTAQWQARTNAELNALGAEVCRLQADAARYRWLAQDDERIGERLRNTLDTWDGCDGKAGFDSAIDAAMRDAPNVAIES